IDAYGNPTQILQTNYTGLPGTQPTQQSTNISYLHSSVPGYTGKWILNRPFQVNAGDGGANPMTTTAYSYDYYTTQFTNAAGVTQHDAFFDTFYTLRGNVYQKVVGINPDPQATTTYYYDTAGNAVKVVDPNSHATQATFDTSTNYTFPKQV